MNILVINAGSSSLKSSIFNFSLKSDPLWSAELDFGQGTGQAVLTTTTSSSTNVQKNIKLQTLEHSFELVFETAWKGKDAIFNSPSEIQIAAHRIVHGGDQLTKPTRITEETKNQIQQLQHLAPLHNPANLKGIEIAEKLFPKIPQFAVFDTAYHATLSEAVRTYPLPEEFRKLGIQKYGFHGISHQYCTEKAFELASNKFKAEKILTCHLGNGSSLAASIKGRCIDTTMGFTPLDGLMMGSRCGALDPGALIHLLREKNFSMTELEDILYYKSGFVGICNASDMRSIEEKIDNGNEKAILALKMYIHRLQSYIGSMTAVMDGLDVLVFTAGIGENSKRVRQEICKGLTHLGISLDNHLNLNCIPDQDIASASSRIPILVIHTREDYAIAKKVCNLL